MERNDRSKHRPKFNMRFVHHRRRTVLLVLLGIVLLLIGGFYGLKAYQQGESKALAPYPVRGCVVDQADGAIDFQALSKKVSFVYLNATTGATYFDDNFNTNYDRLRATNLKVGFIHNFSFEKGAQPQSKYIVHKVRSDSGQLPIAIRVSYYGDDDEKHVDWKKQGPVLADLVRLLANDYGRQVIIKTTPEIKKAIESKYIKQSHFWLEDSQLKKRGKRIEYVEFDTKNTFKNDGTKVNLPVSYFNGSKEQWEYQNP